LDEGPIRCGAGNHYNPAMNRTWVRPLVRAAVYAALLGLGSALRIFDPGGENDRLATSIPRWCTWR